jgi:hypothetical protein
MFSAAFLLTFAPRKPEFRYLYPNPYSWSWQTLAVWVCVLQAIFHANCESVERMMVATYTQYLLDCLDAAVKSGWDSLVGFFGTWFHVREAPTLVLDPASNEYSHWFAMHQLRRMKLAATAVGTWEGMHKPASKGLRDKHSEGSGLELVPMSAWIDASQYALPAMCTHGLRPWADEAPRLARDGIFTATDYYSKLARTAPRLQQNYYLQLQGTCTWVDGRRKHGMLYFNPTDWDDFGGAQEGNEPNGVECKESVSKDYGVAFDVTRRPFAQDEGDPRDYVPLWTSINVRLATGLHVCVRCDVLRHNKSGFEPPDDALELNPATSGFGGIKSVVVPVDEMLGGVSANTFGFRCGHQCINDAFAGKCSVMRLAKNVLVLVHPSDAHKLLQHETSSSGLHTAPPTADAAGGEVLKVAGYQALSVVERGTPYTDLGLLVGEPSLVPQENLARYRPALECGVCAMYNSAEEASKLRDGKVPLLRESMRAASADMQALAQAGILSKSGAEWRPCDCNRVLERNREQHREYMAYA